MATLESLVPTPSDLAQWQNIDPSEFEVPTTQVQRFLQLATDLLVLSAGMTTAPEPDTPLGRVVRAGILDMAWYIGVSLGDREESFSAFSNERIGSYNYSKVAKAAQDGQATGVPFFDTALKWLLGSEFAGDATVLMSTERVFPSPRSAYMTEQYGDGVFHLEDPSEAWGYPL